MALEHIIVAHLGAPCTPPIVDGIEFVPLDEDGLFVAEVSEEQAADLCRIPAFTRYGGSKQFPVPPVGDADQQALIAQAAAAAAAAQAADAAAQAAADEAALADKEAADAAAAASKKR